MKPHEITSILRHAQARVANPDSDILHLLTDSRRSADLPRSLFVAIPTKRNTGSRYVLDLYQRGVRNFIVPADAEPIHAAQFALCTDANLWSVPDPVKALQQLAAHHRAQFSIPVIGITGSNGKTIVKDWIVQLLSPDCRIVASPRSYNSQIGVPLSVWQIDPADELAVFEAGISQPAEMENLRRVINPTIGIFTNIGQAHDENFISRQQKIAEKLQLFTHCQTLIYCSDHKDIHSALAQLDAFRSLRRFTWGHSDSDSLQILSAQSTATATTLSLRHLGQPFQVTIPFADRASVENALHCVALLCLLGCSTDTIARRCLRLTPVAMRLEIGEAINNSLLINDSYSLDLDSLAIALDFVQHDRRHSRRALIISDLLQAGIPEPDLYAQVASLARSHGITRLIGIGPALQRNSRLFHDLQTAFFPTTDECIRQFDFDSFDRETILLKGARAFHFEDIARLLQRRNHQTIMEVNLDNLVANLNYYRSLLRPTTRLMAMVKAASYGAGKTEVAAALQYAHADYLTVAYADEGVDLRRGGISLPIMVMNPEEESFDDIIRYHLEPDIYSFRILHLFAQAVRLLSPADPVPVHVELDTGMHRLGFSGSDLDPLAALFADPACPLRVRSIFSHLACADDPAADDFTLAQIDRFTRWSQSLRSALADPSILCHILNSSGIERFPQAQMDMVRLGIGLYGLSPQPQVQRHLRPVSTLRTHISQIKDIPAGDSVGYNRRFVAQRPTRVAILAIGYADGLNRHLGGGNGRVLIHGRQAPIIGSVCMDMCFLDVTDIPCREGDEAILFGPADLLCRQAQGAGTIPYEILTSVSPRVKRIYIQE